MKKTKTISSEVRMMKLKDEDVGGVSTEIEDAIDDNVAAGVESPEDYCSSFDIEHNLGVHDDRF